jgi:exopolysaccharide biosynthesis polyprenyl glycosylphosphotransferase
MDQAETREHSLALGQRTLRRARIVRTSRERLARWMAAEVAVDVVMLAAAALSFDLVFSIQSSPEDRPTWHLLFSAIFVLLLASRGLYRQRLRLQVLDDLPTLAATSAAVAMAVISAHALLGSDTYTSFTVHYWLFATGWVALGRSGLHVVQARSRSRGDAVRPTLIAGAGKLGHVVARRLLERPELGLRPVGFLDKEPLDMGMDSVQLPVLGASWDLDRIISEYGVQHVIVTFSTAPHHVLLALARRCRELGVSVSVVPRLFELGGARVTAEQLGGIPLVSVDPADPHGWQYTLKYASDRLVAALALLVVLPLIAAIVIAIRLTMGSPVFYRQTRVGRDGRLFGMVKFRTMKGDPAREGEADVDWALEQIGADPDERWLESSMATTAKGATESADDRRTRLGRLLRHFSLDELPQVLNVLRGEMSLVGPRPERVAYVQRFEPAVYRYRDRHRVKSGITGWAQVNGLRGRTSLADRVEWDNFYVENWSPWLDLKIILLTTWCILRGEHEKEEE